MPHDKKPKPKPKPKAKPKPKPAPKPEKSFGDKVAKLIKNSFRTPASTMSSEAGPTSARTKRRIKQFNESLGLEKKKKKN